MAFMHSGDFDEGGRVLVPQVKPLNYGESD